MKTRRNSTLAEFISTRLEKNKTTRTNEWRLIVSDLATKSSHSILILSFFNSSQSPHPSSDDWHREILISSIFSFIQWAFRSRDDSETGEKNKRLSCMFDLSSVQRALIKIPWIPMLSCVPTSMILTLCSLSIDIRYALWVGLHHTKTMTVSSQWLRNLILSGTSTSQIFEQKKK